MKKLPRMQHRELGRRKYKREASRHWERRGRDAPQKMNWKPLGEVMVENSPELMKDRDL